MKHIGEIKIGVFVICGLVLLIFGWAYLREFSIKMQHNFTVVFNDVIGLTKGSFVRVNGLRVGRVDKLTLDTQANRVLVEARIQIPDINIPKDSKVYIRTSGYVGDKYLDILLGMSSDHIMSGDVVIGETPFDAFQSLETVSQVLNELDPALIGRSIQEVTLGTASLIKKVDSVVENTDKVVQSLPRGNELEALVKKAHETVSQLNTVIEKTQQLAVDKDAQGSLNKLLTQASVISSDLNQTLKNANNLANNKEIIEDVNLLLIRASKVIEQLDELRADPLIQNELRQTLGNANKAAKKIAVTTDEVSMALRKRFLIPRLWFGRLLPKRTEVDE